MLRRAFILVLILVLSSLAISAQESNELGDDANACNEGGSMEGKCNIDFNGDGEVSDYEVSWAWTCGWYMIRYDAGVFARNQVPVFCSSLLPAEIENGGSGGSGGDGGYTGFCSYYYSPSYYGIWQIIGPGSYVFSHFSTTTEGNPPCGPDLPV